MKKILVVLAIVSLTGCGKVANMWSSFKSSTGLMTRTVTLYSADGKVLKSWVMSNEAEYEGPVAKFVDDHGNSIRVSGTFVIEGK